MMVGHESNLWCMEIMRGQSAGLEMKGIRLRFLLIFMCVCVLPACVSVRCMLDTQ